LLLRFLPLEHPTLITKNHWVFQQSARLSLRGLGISPKKVDSAESVKENRRSDHRRSLTSKTDDKFCVRPDRGTQYPRSVTPSALVAFPYAYLGLADSA